MLRLLLINNQIQSMVAQCSNHDSPSVTSMYSSDSPSGTGGRGLALGLPGVVAGSDPADWRRTDIGIQNNINQGGKEHTPTLH